MCGGYGLFKSDGTLTHFQGCQRNDLTALADAHHLGIGRGVPKAFPFIFHGNGGLVTHMDGWVRTRESRRSESGFYFADDMEIAGDRGWVVLIITWLGDGNRDIIVVE